MTLFWTVSAAIGFGAGAVEATAGERVGASVFSVAAGTGATVLAALFVFRSIAGPGEGRCGEGRERH